MRISYCFSPPFHIGHKRQVRAGHMGSSDSEEEDTNKSLDEEEIHRIQQIKTHCKGLPDEKKRIQRMLDELDADMLERRTAVKRRMKQNQTLNSGTPAIRGRYTAI